MEEFPLVIARKDLRSFRRVSLVVGRFDVKSSLSAETLLSISCRSIGINDRLSSSARQVVLFDSSAPTSFVPLRLLYRTSSSIPSLIVIYQPGSSEFFYRCIYMVSYKSRDPGLDGFISRKGLTRPTCNLQGEEVVNAVCGPPHCDPVYRLNHSRHRFA